MRTWMFLALLALCAAPGCYRQQVNQQLMERELRLQEDCIWKYKWALEDRERELTAARDEIATLKKETGVLRDKNHAGSEPELGIPPGILGPAGGGTLGTGETAPRLPPAPGSGSSPGNSGPAIPPGGGIEIDPGQPFTPGAGSGASSGRSGYRGRNGSIGSSSSGSESRDSNQPQELTGPALSQASLLTPNVNPLRPNERLNADAEVERIVLNEGLTGGLNQDGKPGDELLGVVFELRDPGDYRILAPGDVSIVVVDPALEGDAAAVAKWTFDSDRSVGYVRRDAQGASYHFELPWPKTPEHGDLRLFVRFTTYDGRRLEANLPIEVQLASSAESEPRTGRRGNASLVQHFEPTDKSEAPEETPPPAKADVPATERAKWSPYR